MGGGKGGSDAAKDAGYAQIVALDKQIAEQRAAAAAAEADYAPYKESGLSALDQYRTLIGLGGADAQNQADGSDRRDRPQQRADRRTDESVADGF